MISLPFNGGGWVAPLVRREFFEKNRSPRAHRVNASTETHRSTAAISSFVAPGSMVTGSDYSRFHSQAT